MAKIEKVLPSVFGQPRAAQLSPRHPGMPNHYEGLSRDLKSFGADMRGVFDGLVRLGEEGQRAALSQAQADYDLEVSEALQREVYSLKGLSASEAESKAGEIFRRAENRQFEKLGAYGGRVGQDFQTMTVRSRASMLPRVLRHAEREIRNARVASAKQVQKNKLELHSLTGNDMEIEDALAAHADSASALGMEMVDPERFDRDAAAGFVTLGGKRVEIRDGKFNGPNGPVSVSALRSRIADTPYARERQLLIDDAHSARITQLIHWNNVPGAEELLEKYNPANGGGDRADIPLAKYPMSERVFAAMKEQVGHYRTKLNANLEGGATVAAVQAEYAANDKLSMGGKIWSPAIETKVAEALMAQHEKTLNDPTGIGTMKYNAMRQGFDQARANAHAWEKAQTEAFIRSLEKWGGSEENLLLPGNEAKLLNEFGTAPESYIKENYRPVIARKVALSDAARRNTPEAKQAAKARMLEFARCAAAGIPLDLNKSGSPRSEALVFDLSKEDQRHTAVSLLGFNERERARLQNIMESKVPMDMAAAQLTSLLREFPGLENVTDTTVLRVAPEIIEELQKTAALFPEREYKTAKDEQWVKDRLREILKTKVRKDTTLWWYSDLSFPEHLRKYVGKDGTLREPGEGEVGNTFRDFDDTYCTTADQLAAQEKYEQEMRLRAIPKREGETERDLARTRRLPQKADKLGFAEARAARLGLVKGESERRDEEYVYRTKAGHEAWERRKAEEGERKRKRDELGAATLWRIGESLRLYNDPQALAGGYLDIVGAK